MPEEQDPKKVAEISLEKEQLDQYVDFLKERLRQIEYHKFELEKARKFYDEATFEEWKKRRCNGGPSLSTR